MPSNITAENLVSAGIRLLEALSCSPSQSMAVEDAARAIGVTTDQLSHVVDTLSALSDRTSGARAAIGIQDGNVVLIGDAARIMPRRLSMEESMVLAHVLDVLSIDDDVKERVSRAIMPLTGGGAHQDIAEPARYGTCFSQLGEAIEDGIRCRVTYRSLNDSTPSVRLVDPLAILEEHGETYLVAWNVDKDAQRRYRLDRIQRVEFTEDSVAFHDATISSTADSLRATGTPVRIRVPSEAYAARLDWAGMGEIALMPTGEVEFVAYCSSERWLFDQVLSAGGDMVIVSPLQLRKRLSTYAESLLK